MSRSLRLLLIDDSSLDEEMLLSRLRGDGWSVECMRVETREAMDEALSLEAPDLIVSDNSMPRFSAAEALKVAQERAPEVPFLVISGTIGEEQAVALVKAGAHDFLLKDRLSRLDSAVGRALRDRQARTALRQAETERHRLDEHLRQVQKMEAIGRLAGSIAHDFNNILAVVMGETELAQELTLRGSAVREHLEQIAAAGERAAAVVRQLMSFSRGPARGERRVDLRSIVDGLRGMLERLVGSAVEVNIRFDDPMCAIRADPTAIEQILINLAVNARDAMPGGGRFVIEISTLGAVPEATKPAVGLTAGRLVCLVVTDTGEGMAAEVRARAFEPFFTTKREGRGTGLGLATVYSIVQQCSGSIYIDSELGSGTTFRIYFPAVEDEPANPAVPRASSH